LRRKRFVKTPLHSFRRCAEPRSFTVLDDNTAVEVISPNLDHPHQYIVQNIVTKKATCTIDLQEVGCDRIMAGGLQGSILTLFDKQGKIYQFNILEGDCFSMMQGAPLSSDEAVFHFNSQEIVTAYDSQITIWNRKTSSLKQTIAISTLDIIGIASTPHFIIIVSSPYTSHRPSVSSIRKKDLKIEVLDENIDWWGSLESSGNICAFLSSEGVVKTFKDESEESLMPSHTFTLKSANAGKGGCLYIAQNWLGVSHNGFLRLWDVETGNEISTFDIGQNFPTFFRTNGEVLCTQASRLDNLFFGDLIYTLYDFRVGQNASKEAPKKSFLQRCVTWLRKKFQ
jgi:WD40 repeat protein